MSKRQRLSNQSYIQPIPPTVYEAPNESLVYFPSSIVNGVTKQNGLMSLTLKSVTSAKLVEETSWLYGALFNTAEYPSRISAESVNLEDKIAQLKSEVAGLRAQRSTQQKPEVVDSLSRELESSLKEPAKFAEFKAALLKLHASEHPDTHLAVGTSGQFESVTGLDFGVKVDTKKDGELPLPKSAQAALEGASAEAEADLEQAEGILPEAVAETVLPLEPLGGGEEAPLVPEITSAALPDAGIADSPGIFQATPPFP